MLSIVDKFKHYRSVYIAKAGTCCILLASAIVIFVLAFAIYVLFTSLGKPILDYFAFRQTQTALTAYWLLQGGPWLTYETPVLGAPWAVPFEFPVFQLIVAGVAAVGVPLDAAGRLVSFAFFLATLWPLAILFRALGASRFSYLAMAALFVSSPLYLYWSRAFLIESCALFFSVFWLALLARYLSGGGWVSAVGALGAGCLAVLAKSTTFPSFALLGAVGAAWVMYCDLRRRVPVSQLLRRALTLLAIGVLPFLTGALWVAYSDGIKETSEVGAQLTSSALSNWNFGALNQRFSRELWVSAIYDRIIPDAFGTFHIVSIACCLIAVVSKRYRYIAIACLVGFLVSILLFTNLHIIHNYYQVSNALFLTAAVALGIGAIFDGGRPHAAIILLCALVVGQIYFFNEKYMGIVRHDYRTDRLLRIALIAKERIPVGQSLIVIGDDWSSVIPYYAERKSLAIAGWFTEKLVGEMVANPQSFLGDQPFGGIVYCADKLSDYGPRARLLEKLIAEKQVLGEFGGCQVLSAT